MTTQRLIENNRFVEGHSEFSPSVRLLAQQSADELSRLSKQLEETREALKSIGEMTPDELYDGEHMPYIRTALAKVPAVSL